MPGRSVTLNFDQGVQADLILKDSVGTVTTDLGTYTVTGWGTDDLSIIELHSIPDENGRPLSVQVQAAIPPVNGTGVVNVHLVSSDSGNHPNITDSFSVTIVNAPSPPPGPVSSVDFAIGTPGPRLF